jgi:hypothetical protein
MATNLELGLRKVVAAEAAAPAVGDLAKLAERATTELII